MTDWDRLTRPETTRRLSDMLVRDVFDYPDPRVYWAREVTYGFTTGKAVRVDFMRFTPKNTLVGGLEMGEFTAYEVKSCKPDFDSGHGLNLIADRNYVVVPPGLVGYVARHVPYGTGVLTPRDDGNGRERLTVVRKSVLHARRRPAVELMFGMMRSLGRERLTLMGEAADDGGQPDLFGDA